MITFFRGNEHIFSRRKIKMVKTSKKILACFLAILMIVSFVPITSFAWNNPLTFVKKDTSWNGYEGKYSAYIHNGGNDYAGIVLKEVDNSGVINVAKGQNFQITLSCGTWTATTASGGTPQSNDLHWHYGNGTDYVISSCHDNNQSIGYWRALYNGNAVQSAISGTFAGQPIPGGGSGRNDLRAGSGNGGSTTEATGIFHFTPSSFPQLNTPGTYQIQLDPTICFNKYWTGTFGSNGWNAEYGWGYASADSSRVINVTVNVVEFDFVNAEGTSLKKVAASSYAEALNSKPANTATTYTNLDANTHKITSYSWPSNVEIKTSSAGTKNQTFFTTIEANTDNHRGGDNVSDYKMQLCSDGGSGNTDAGLLKFPIGEFPSSVDSATLNLNFDTSGTGFNGEQLKVVQINSNVLTNGNPISNTPRATGNFNNVFGSTFALNSSAYYTSALTAFGVTESNVIKTFDIEHNKAAADYKVDITNLVNEAKKANKTDLWFLLIIPKSNTAGSGGNGGWSDINVHPNNCNVSWDNSPANGSNSFAKYTTVSSNSSRGGDDKVTLTSDGESGNTSIGVFAFDISNIPASIDTANFKLDYQVYGFAGEDIRIIPITNYSNISFSSHKDQSNAGSVFKSGYGENSDKSYNDVLAYFGVNSSDAVITKTISSKGTTTSGTQSETFSILNAVKAAKAAGRSELAFVAVVKTSGKASSASSYGWSDFHIMTSSKLEWSSDASTKVNEVKSESTGSHVFMGPVTANNDGTHSRACLYCDAKNIVACSGGKATCTTLAVCSTCNTSYGNLATTHALTPVDAKEPTCTHTGNYAYWVCDDCGKLFSDATGTTETTLAAVTKAKTGIHTGGTATCTQKGRVKYTCEKCSLTSSTKVFMVNWQSNWLRCVWALRP